MADLFEFMMRHWILSGAFVIVLLLFILNEVRQRGAGNFKLSSQQVVDLINHQNAVVIDVRNDELFNSEHILGAKNYPHHLMASKMNKLSKFKTKPIVVVCEQGSSSPKIAHQLQKEGFESVFYLAGGIAGWKADGLPLAK